MKIDSGLGLLVPGINQITGTRDTENCPVQGSRPLLIILALCLSIAVQKLPNLNGKEAVTKTEKNEKYDETFF